MDRDSGGPSASSTMRKLEEGRQLPWRMVTYNTWSRLANKLDVPSPVSNNDWKGLAELLGFSTEDILVLENAKERSTIALFKNYLPKKDASVNSVAKALKQMNRDDALQILLDAVPDIEAQYDAEAQKPMAEAMEGMDSCITTIAQAGCGCLGPSVLSCNSQHRSGGCSPCHTHTRHIQHPACSVAAGGCCCRHAGSLHCHSPPVSCAPHLHTHTHAGRASPRALSSGCRAMGGMAVSNIPQQNYNVPLTSGHQDQGYRSFTGGGKNGDYYSGSPSHSGVERSPARQHPLSSVSPARQAQEQVLSYSQVMQESMVVHYDQDATHHGDLRSFLPNNTGMEVDGEREEPALLHTTIVRGQGLVSMSSVGGQALALEGTDMGEDTPSTSVEELSSSDSSSRLSNLPLNVMRQVSEECNANQPLLPVAASPSRKPVYGCSDAPDSLMPWGAELPAATDRSQRNVVGGNQPGTLGNREGQSSLKELENLSQMPGRFMPGDKFTKMVAKQQIEDIPPNRSLQVNIKRERDSSRSCQFSGLPGNRSGSGNGSKYKGLAGADTYPMRVKPQTGGATVEEVRNRQPGMLMKSTSVPIDMKMEEFKKAFRHIKVFVTYANDSKSHCRQVLSLCNCLDRNGFSCCVDVSSRHDSPDQIQTTREWCGRKFKEADFVLICLSPQYLKDIGSVDRGDRNSLHTAFIYQLMQEEYHATKRLSRFVPLYMEGALCDPGPAWLARHLSYRWPQQYKDLLWMLTKPEDRIKQKSRSSPQKSFSVLRDKVNSRHGDQN